MDGQNSVHLHACCPYVIALIMFQAVLYSKFLMHVCFFFCTSWRLKTEYEILNFYVLIFVVVAITKEKMPACLFFLNGTTTKSCTYLVFRCLLKETLVLFCLVKISYCLLWIHCKRPLILLFSDFEIDWCLT